MKTKQLLTLAAAMLIVVIIGVIAMPAAQAQAVYGSVLGTVTDPQGAAVPNAKVTVTNQRKNTSDTTTSNADGNYSVTHLIPDVYTIRAEAAGFKASEIKDVLVSADAARVSTWRSRSAVHLKRSKSPPKLPSSRPTAPMSQRVSMRNTWRIYRSSTATSRPCN